MKNAAVEPLPLEWPSVMLEVRCAGVSQGIFSGTLILKVGDHPGPTEEVGVNCDDLDNTLQFSNAEHHGELFGPAGGFLALGASSYTLGTKGSKGEGVSGRIVREPCYPSASS